MCWDNFDPDEIWAQVPVRMQRSGSIGEAKGTIRSSRIDAVDDKRTNTRASTSEGGRWQRGVALPPPEESANRRRSQQEDAENPNDLWDDPLGGGPTGAASDFSAFGAIPDEPGSGDGGDAFDFDKMTEATNRFEMERRGSKGSDGLSDDEDEKIHSIHVNPQRPLASAGTTIQSGSGDDVNVFEDFETPGESDQSEALAKGAEENKDASSRLMEMIGVNKEEPNAVTAEPEPEVPALKQEDAWVLGGDSSKEQRSAVIPSNPWGSIIGADPNLQQQSGIDLSSRLEAASAEQKAREAQIAAEMERRKEQEEEAKRRAQQQQQQQQQPAAKPSQVELVLMERISTFLENSWGRSDLMSILSTLHAEDSRVIPLLGNVDALRALIARHPTRIGLRQDPAFGSEMAVLLLTNSQYMKVEQLARQEELQRLEQQRREEAMRQAAAQKPQVPVISADAPWFYSDPQGNVQVRTIVCTLSFRFVELLSCLLLDPVGTVPRRGNASVARGRLL